VSCLQGSFLDFDWSDGDVVFANSTCFDDELMSAMGRQAELLRPGSMFITFSKALPSGCFEVIEKKRYKMSWGPATVFIQRRLADDGTALPSYRLNLLPSDNIEYDDNEENSSARSVLRQVAVNWKKKRHDVAKSTISSSNKAPLPNNSNSSNHGKTTTKILFLILIYTSTITQLDYTLCFFI